MSDLSQLHDEFVKHAALDAKQFDDIRAGQKEIMDMLTPIYKAFNFREELGDATKKWVINTTKVCGLILALGGVVTLLWKLFGYLITQAK